MSTNNVNVAQDIEDNLKDGVQTYTEVLNINNRIDVAQAQTLIKTKLLDHAPFESAAAQGDALEEVVHYFLEHSGLFVCVEHDTSNQIHQLDHTADISNHAFGLFSRAFSIKQLGVIGESKNYAKKKKPMGVDIVYKVEGIKLLSGLGLSMYFTRGGLTGTELRDAIALLAHFCNHPADKTYAIVFSDDDWSYLHQKPQNFSKLVFIKLRQYRNHKNFDITYSAVDSFQM